MDTQHLKAFTTVVQLGSFTDAADKLHLTQPAVSKRIAALEQQLGCRLIDRVKRGVSLTEAGQALLPRAQAILRSVSDTELAISNLAGSVGGKLKLATSHHIGLHHLPRILKLFTRRFPEVELDLDFLGSERAYDAIASGDAELGIVTLSSLAGEDISNRPLWQDPLSFVVATDHPLRHTERASLADLANYPAILPDQSTQTTRLIHALFANQQQTLRTGMTTNFMETIKMMVSIGLGWGALPNTMLDEKLWVLEIDSASLSRTLGYIHHRRKTLSNAARAFIETLQEHAH
ncbi:MAG: LysR family transcriptional regulator [Gammaproteobacteria bacterium]|nr:LysR family transcriptional regulator [Gammaproteobacteria bacterium]